MIKTPEYEAERATAAKWEKTRRAKDRYAAEPEGSDRGEAEGTEPGEEDKPPTDIASVISRTPRG